MYLSFIRAFYPIKDDISCLSVLCLSLLAILLLKILEPTSALFLSIGQQISNMGGGDKEARQRGGEATIRGATTTRRCGDSRLDDEEGSSDWRLDNDEGRRSLEVGLDMGDWAVSL
ncbi:hypothetical protein ACOSQ3_009640 [Xanthoceras sorbifolium]